MSKVTLSDKSAMKRMLNVPSRIVGRKERNIASMQDIAAAIRKVAKEKRIKKYEVRPWKRSIFMMYTIAPSTVYFYHIPDDQMTQEDFEKIIALHGKFTDNTWLLRRLMSGKTVKKILEVDPKKDGKWLKYRVPSLKPFGIKGDFLVVTTGYSDE